MQLFLFDGFLCFDYYSNFTEINSLLCWLKLSADVSTV
jgi:hypothetical protein